MDNPMNKIELPPIKKEHLPYAYAFAVLGLWAILGSPEKVVKGAGAYLIFKRYVDLAREKLNNRT